MIETMISGRGTLDYWLVLKINRARGRAAAQQDQQDQLWKLRVYDVHAPVVHAGGCVHVQMLLK